MRRFYLLDPDVHFLNHGSYGATPRPVFADYHAWQLRMERQPVQFFGRDLTGLLKEARDLLATYLGTDGDNLVYVPNATFGVNIIARSIALQPGDEILTCDHEYGACVNAWEYSAAQRGATVVRRSVPVPVVDTASVVDAIWQGVTPNTRVIFLSHITSPTALILPIEEIGRRAREAGIYTVIDGAHAPGQLPLNLTDMPVDFYLGNAHKWLSSPKGAAFLHADPRVQDIIEPLVVGWGWGPQKSINFGSPFLERLQFLGTNDLSAYLAVPAAIRFQEEHDWAQQRARCHALLRATITEIAARSGQPLIYPDDSWYVQMAVAPLPDIADSQEFRLRLVEQYRVEVPVFPWEGHSQVRISVQAYNTQEDLDALLHALACELGI